MNTRDEHRPDEHRIELDNLLDRMDAPPPSSALMGRIMAEAETTPRSIANWMQSLWAQTAALMAAAVLGLTVGLVEAAEVSDQDDLFSAQDYTQSTSVESWFGEDGE